MREDGAAGYEWPDADGGPPTYAGTNQQRPEGLHEWVANLCSTVVIVVVKGGRGRLWKRVLWGLGMQPSDLLVEEEIRTSVCVCVCVGSRSTYGSGLVATFDACLGIFVVHIRGSRFRADALGGRVVCRCVGGTCG